jgi:hypothetical protein
MNKIRRRKASDSTVKKVCKRLGSEHYYRYLYYKQLGNGP